MAAEDVDDPEDDPAFAAQLQELYQSLKVDAKRPAGVLNAVLIYSLFPPLTVSNATVRRLTACAFGIDGRMLTTKLLKLGGSLHHLAGVLGSCLIGKKQCNYPFF